MTSRDFFTYFNDLNKRHPIKSDHKVKMRLVDKLIYHGKEINGLARCLNNKIAIYVVTKRQCDSLVIKTIAHEYRHVIQWVNMDWVSKDASDPAMERDAQMFGQQEVWRMNGY